MATLKSINGNILSITPIKYQFQGDDERWVIVRLKYKTDKLEYEVDDPMLTHDEIKEIINYFNDYINKKQLVKLFFTEPILSFLLTETKDNIKDNIYNIIVNVDHEGLPDNLKYNDGYSFELLVTIDDIRLFINDLQVELKKL